jgi:hypothetical protein
MMRTNSQREVMQRLVSKYGRQEDIVCREYAKAEERGEVSRRRNKYGLSAEGYARALWRDGHAKGWLCSVLSVGA